MTRALMVGASLLFFSTSCLAQAGSCTHGLGPGSCDEAYRLQLERIHRQNMLQMERQMEEIKMQEQLKKMRETRQRPGSIETAPIPDRVIRAPERHSQPASRPKMDSEECRAFPTMCAAYQ